MNKLALATAFLAIAAVGSSGLVGVAFAQYYAGNVGAGGETGKNTLEEALKLQRDRVLLAESNPASGSGTPYLDAGSVIAASAIAAAIFGGIAATFFIRSRSGKYAPMGRG